MCDVLPLLGGSSHDGQLPSGRSGDHLLLDRVVDLCAHFLLRNPDASTPTRQLAAHTHLFPEKFKIEEEGEGETYLVLSSLPDGLFVFGRDSPQPLLLVRHLLLPAGRLLGGVEFR